MFQVKLYAYASQAYKKLTVKQGDINPVLTSVSKRTQYVSYGSKHCSFASSAQNKFYAKSDVGVPTCANQRMCRHSNVEGACVRIETEVYLGTL